MATIGDMLGGGGSGGTGPAPAPIYSQQYNAAPIGSFAVGDVLSGRVSLVFLEGAIVALVLFYVWTHKIQGGG